MSEPDWLDQQIAEEVPGLRAEIARLKAENEELAEDVNSNMRLAANYKRDRDRLREALRAAPPHLAGARLRKARNALGDSIAHRAPTDSEGQPHQQEEQQ